MTRKRILIVEDEEVTRDVLAQAMNIFGYDAIVAEDGRSALQKYLEHAPDVVVSDIHMPVMNGIDLVKELREINPELPIILITGYDAQEARRIARKSHVNAIIIKPFRLQQLKDLLDKVFANETPELVST